MLRMPIKLKKNWESLPSLRRPVPNNMISVGMWSTGKLSAESQSRAVRMEQMTAGEFSNDKKPAVCILRPPEKSTGFVSHYSIGPNLDWKRTMLALLFEIFLIFSHSLSFLIHQKY